MKKKDYLICYDISDKKRLSKIAKIVEKKAFRIQRSIYLLDNASKKELYDLLDEVLEILNKKQDDLRVYIIKNKGIRLGSAVDLDDPLIF